MAFFKSRSNSTASAEERNPEAGEAQSMDVLRQRARHRLIGATVLVLIAVIGFPMVFDTKPRDVAADIRIDMPERDAVRPAQAPVAPAPAATAPVPDDVKAPPSQAPEPQAPESAKLPESTVANAQKPEAKSAPTEEVVSTTKPDADKPRVEGAARFIVQVGAFSDEAKVKEVRAKLEKAGLKTYVHVAQTKEGKRTRVRIGPFASKEEAQRMVTKVKGLNLSAAVLTL
jgi:DedD protein